MRSVTLPSGEQVPALGIGTLRMGENRTARAEELATLRLALDHGVAVIDTAEMYGEGLSEMLVGEALAGRRDDAFLVSKIYPHNATRHGTAAACERSLARLRTDRIDLYLLHWRGSVPLAETLDAFQGLQRAGKIRYFGVSNFGLADLRELWSVPAGPATATDQLLYNLARRNIEWDLLPWARERRIPIMAYSPLEQGRLIRDPRLVALAERSRFSPAQAALAWLLCQEGVITIPKTGNRERLRENLSALQETLSSAQLHEFDQAFPPPAGPRPLETL